MKLSTVKRYRRKHKLLGALLLRNPVLVMGLDLPFIIAAATSLKNAAAMAIQMLMVHMITVMLGVITGRRLPMWARTVVNVVISTAVTVGALWVVGRIISDISNSLGMYLYLMAVNSMTVIQASRPDKYKKVGQVAYAAFINVLGFSLVAGVVAFLREYFGNGTLWGNPIRAPFRLDALMIPFGGFLLMGFLLAFTRFLNKSVLGLSMRERLRKEERMKKIHIESVEVIDI